MKEIEGKKVDSLKKELKKLKEELEKCQKEKEDYLNGWKRERADFLNYQKQQKEIMEKISEKAIEDLIKELLEVLDSLELGIKSIKEKEVFQGMNLVKEKFLKVFEKYGVKEIEVLGKKFDPFSCEVVEEVESDQNPGTVVSIIRKGYQLKNSIILRPAQVKISRKRSLPTLLLKKGSQVPKNKNLNMAIIRFEPFFREISKFLDEEFVPMIPSIRFSEPAIDVYEKGNDIIVEAEVPGMDPKDINIEIEDKTLRISGKMEKKEEVKEKNYYRKEIKTGSFERVVSLPSEVKEKEVEATMKDGILKIVLPKQKTSSVKKIEIKKK